MNITIKKAVQNDIPVIIQLLKSLYLELGEEAESIKFLTPEFVAGIIVSERTEIYLASDQAKVVGIMTLTACQSIYAGGEYGLLDEMYSLPEYRSRGIGARFIEKAKQEAILRKWKRLDVTAPTEGFERTLKFYERCGFVFTGPKLKFVV